MLPEESRYSGEELADAVVVGDGICEGDTDGDAGDDDGDGDGVCDVVSDSDAVGDADRVCDAVAVCDNDCVAVADATVLAEPLGKDDAVCETDAEMLAESDAVTLAKPLGDDDEVCETDAEALAGGDMVMLTEPLGDDDAVCEKDVETLADSDAVTLAEPLGDSDAVCVSDAETLADGEPLDDGNDDAVAESVAETRAGANDDRNKIPRKRALRQERILAGIVKQVQRALLSCRCSKFLHIQSFFHKVFSHLFASETDVQQHFRASDGDAWGVAARRHLAVAVGGSGGCKDRHLRDLLDRCAGEPSRASHSFRGPCAQLLCPLSQQQGAARPFTAAAPGVTAPPADPPSPRRRRALRS